MTRTTIRRVTFKAPFTLKGIAEPFAAGAYDIESEEELMQDLSFIAYRRIATAIYLPAGSPLPARIVSIDPDDLEAALARDAR